MVHHKHGNHSYAYHVDLEIANILLYLLHHFFLKYFKAKLQTYGISSINSMHH